MQTIQWWSSEVEQLCNRFNTFTTKMVKSEKTHPHTFHHLDFTALPNTCCPWEMQILHGGLLNSWFCCCSSEPACFCYTLTKFSCEGKRQDVFSVCLAHQFEKSCFVTQYFFLIKAYLSDMQLECCCPSHRKNSRRTFVISHIILSASREALKEDSEIKPCLHYCPLSCFSGWVFVYQM